MRQALDLYLRADLLTAAVVFGLSRSHAYDLINRAEFPAKVINVGS